jgi:hypothetical protein
MPNPTTGVLEQEQLNFLPLGLSRKQRESSLKS